MKFKFVFKFINSYTKQSFLSITRFNTESEGYRFLKSRPAWQEWEIVRVEID